MRIQSSYGSFCEWIVRGERYCIGAIFKDTLRGLVHLLLITHHSPKSFRILTIWPLLDPSAHIDCYTCRPILSLIVDFTAPKTNKTELVSYNQVLLLRHHAYLR